MVGIGGRRIAGGGVPTADGVGMCGPGHRHPAAFDESVLDTSRHPDGPEVAVTFHVEPMCNEEGDMTDQDPKNARNDQNEELDADAVEDLEVDEDAEAVRGGFDTVFIMEEEGQPQIE